jgi:anti-sigma B factor antagonist
LKGTVQGVCRVPATESHLAVREVSADLALVVLGGRVDAASVRTQRDQLHALVEKGIHHVVIDLGTVTFLDSAGIAMLVSLLKRVRAADGDVRVVEPAEESVQNILRLTRLDLVFDLKPSVEAALRDFV